LYRGPKQHTDSAEGREAAPPYVRVTRYLPDTDFYRSRKTSLPGCYTLSEEGGAAHVVEFTAGGGDS
jgi:hypothetical protein